MLPYRPFHRDPSAKAGEVLECRLTQQKLKVATFARSAMPALAWQASRQFPHLNAGLAALAGQPEPVYRTKTYTIAACGLSRI
jgi:hypothetical protein